MNEITITDLSTLQQWRGEPPLCIGKSPTADIVLADPAVSRRHLSLFLNEKGELFAQDLCSTNGTTLNESPLKGTARLSSLDRLRIGQSRLQIEFAPPCESSGATAVAQDCAAWREKIIEQLLAKIDLKDWVLEQKTDVSRKQALESLLEEILSDTPLPASIQLDSLRKEILHQILGLGPIQKFLEDPTISEIMINGASEIFIERGGTLTRTGESFPDEESLSAMIDRVLAPLGRRIDEGSPIVDARLPDGSRFNAIIPPLCLKGATVTIRKFSTAPLSLQALLDARSLSPEMGEYLRVAVREKKNILISGNTSSGKTTLLNVLSQFIPEEERIITIEDAAELKLQQHHVIPLETRAANIEGKGGISVRQLVHNALRMRPDRIIVGECRAAETLDMLQAMNTGHKGALTTCHANAPADALRRLEMMISLCGYDIPLRAIREQIASAIEILVHMTRFAEGSRKLTHIAEIDGMEGDTIVLRHLYAWHPREKEFRFSGIPSAWRPVSEERVV